MEEKDLSVGKGKGKKSLILKTWDRCRSLRSSGKKTPFGAGFPKSKSWPRGIGSGSGLDDDKFKSGNRCKVAPEGCFSVYVGPEKQRFVIRTEYANHPLFRMLLEEAEMEYGYNSEGPLVLPCKVDLFYKVLYEMENDDERNDIRQGCSFASSYRLLSPARMVAMN